MVKKKSFKFMNNVCMVPLTHCSLARRTRPGPVRVRSCSWSVRLRAQAPAGRKAALRRWLAARLRLNATSEIRDIISASEISVHRATRALTAALPAFAPAYLVGTE